ncbi:Dihydrolipoyllysine-residue succinyltransferase component of 2-oxoglutarate dehydrogenase complex [Baekduia alba]|uniref:dihydrolipoamide acetyltransferase family protein n=1 Tax=Baekduia alba TaxID=2997333 RepID=UPI002341DE85|nr:dihydrolipoamide acetyltransferase family protein [Baekduia alba]WCB96878.1 Dihydrolipoyllysine-residue succinyltransferase component of 2-oxoglutarate dehydrogenase complex [Baekduia alba]
MAEIRMPKLSDSMEEGTIVRWVIADGADVRRGDELLEVETDKATMSYEAEWDGTLHVVVPEGDTVPVGAVIAHLLAAGEAPPAHEPAAAAAGLATAQAPAALAAPPRPTADRPKASPLARRIAQDLGIDLATLVGSGPQGRVVRRDVEVAGARAEASPARPDVPVTGGDEATGGPMGVVAREPLTRTQVTIARRMAEAKSTMPEFTVTADVDMDAVVELRARLKALDADVTPSVNDMVVKACALALRRHPRANGAYRDDAFERYERVNVGVAVASADALLVPVVHDADRASLGAIARTTRALVQGGRDGTLSAAALAGGTFTVSNLGMFGVTQFTAVLNPPQAAILAVGALQQRAVVRDGALAVGWHMTVTLTADHRILYGADAAAFVADIRAELEQPLRLVL